ncbi:MAG: beta-N-acetylhexosaminidase [Candidatus Omnitrophota bacterium]
MKYFIDLERVSRELRAGMKELEAEYPLTFKKQAGTAGISFLPVDKGEEAGKFQILNTSEGVRVNYVRAVDAFRALGHIFGGSTAGKRGQGYTESTGFKMLGVMLESSRNGVLTVVNVKSLLRKFSLMGINAVMMYTEDTYEVPGQPFFGYLRGGYTQDELKELDSYAAKFGIEMFPCIQTLAHLKQILQWPIAYHDVTDTEEILLVGEDKTYQLLEKMITSASKPYQSKRLHIGMDEAHGLGTGEYRRRHGERRTFDIMNEHLARVCEICTRLGLRPMIWSDMYFRIGSKKNDYYDLDTRIPEDVVKNIPKNVDLVYWDYYHLDYDFYTRFIDLHRSLGKEPVMAPGAWNWGRFWADLPYAYLAVESCMRACRDKSVKEAFITTWGDDGMENDIYSALPAVQFFTEMAYAGKVELKVLKVNFQGTCGTDIDAYTLASRIDTIPCRKDYRKSLINAAKWLLWDDPLIGLCEPLQEGRSFRKEYAKLAQQLEKAITKDALSKSPRLTKSPRLSERLCLPAQIAKVIAIKCDCRKNLVSAYRAKDKKRMRCILNQEVVPLTREVRTLWKIHRGMWLNTYKPFGLEVLEIRYGGLIARLESLQERLKEYLDGKVTSIPEFETKLLKFQEGSAEESYGVGSYRRIATPSAIF